MEHEAIERLRDKHSAWRLMRAGNAALVLSFLGRFFVDENHGATSAALLASALDDELYTLNSGEPEQPRYPRRADEYLEDWAATDAGWLRRFYPLGSDEVHYDATPAFQKAHAWVTGLQVRSFVGTESRLHTIVELLRQIAHGTETDPEVRLAELRRRREAIDQEIAEVEAGTVTILDPVALRDRYQQFAGTARELLSDFREVEENFRSLDRAAREQIAAWEGSKGDLLAELVGNRADINGSDQGRSFQAFYDFLLSEARQDELSALLTHVQSLQEVEADRRLLTIHHDWSEAAERTQRTVRQISEQLRRFLDDQVWLENRRVIDLVRQFETAALACRERPPQLGLEIDEAGLPVALPFERPLYDARPEARVDSLLARGEDEVVDVAALLGQSFVDQARLAANIRSVVPKRSSALLSDIIDLYPLEHGAAEIVAYLALTDEDIESVSRRRAPRDRSVCVTTRRTPSSSACSSTRGTARPSRWPRSSTRRTRPASLTASSSRRPRNCRSRANSPPSDLTSRTCAGAFVRQAPISTRSSPSTPVTSVGCWASGRSRRWSCSTRPCR